MAVGALAEALTAAGPGTESGFRAQAGRIIPAALARREHRCFQLPVGGTFSERTAPKMRSRLCVPQREFCPCCARVQTKQ